MKLKLNAATSHWAETGELPEVTMHWTDYEDAECECDHEHCSHDILTGRSTCELCGATWYPSGHEVKVMRELEDIDLNKLSPNTVICKDDSDGDLPF